MTLQSADLQRRSLGRVRAPRRAVVWILVALLTIGLSVPIGLAVLGNRSSGVSASAGAPAAEPGRAGDATGEVAGKGPAGASSGGAGAAAATAETAAKLVRTAWLGIRVADLTAAAGRVRAMTATAGGQVLSENVVTTSPPNGIATESGASLPPVRSSEARLVLGVPNDRLDGFLADLARIGTVSYRTSQTQDVTDTYVDTSSRVATMQAGLDRVRALLAKATSLDQVISLESELTRRQADLDALRARLAALERQVARSEVTVTLWTPETGPAPDDAGPLGTLRGAWDAFLASLAVIVTGLAVLLPWLVLIGLAALVVRRLLRRQRRGSATPD